MYDVITIGTATRDVFLTSSFFRVLKDPGHLRKIGFPTGEAQCFALGGKIEIGRPVLTTGGGATNAAVTFSRQGFRTAALVKIGQDRSGEGVLQDLESEKVKVIAAFDKKIGTGYSTILLSPYGERTILVYRGASEELRASETGALSRMRARWAYISPGGIKFAAMKKIVDDLYRRGVSVAMNPSKRYLELGTARLKPLLSKLKVIIVNREEAAYLTGIDYKNERKIFEKFDKLVPGIAVMTDGPAGVSVSDGMKIYKAGIFKNKKIIDRTGAGDAFGSGFVAGLMQRGLKTKNYKLQAEDIKYAIRLGSANATSVVEHIGAKEGIINKREYRLPRWSRLAIKMYD
ncbi:MAG: carbohydrate kinase family protein [Parcubacteria group bacterium]|nr:carbohydrate kinase family protein [Parcubacteria group bacterium]